MDDRQRLRRARQRHVEVTKPLHVRCLLDDERRLDDDHMVELEALCLARYLEDGGVPFTRFDDFYDIAAALA